MWEKSESWQFTNVDVADLKYLKSCVISNGSQGLACPGFFCVNGSPTVGMGPWVLTPLTVALGHTCWYEGHLTLRFLWTSEPQQGKKKEGWSPEELTYFIAPGGSLSSQGTRLKITLQNWEQMCAGPLWPPSTSPFTMTCLQKIFFLNTLIQTKLIL